MIPLYLNIGAIQIFPFSRSHNKTIERFSAIDPILTSYSYFKVKSNVSVNRWSYPKLKLPPRKWPLLWPLRRPIANCNCVDITAQAPQEWPLRRPIAGGLCAGSSQRVAAQTPLRRPAVALHRILDRFRLSVEATGKRPIFSAKWKNIHQEIREI